MRIEIDSKACYGCRTCELICSFHHTGAFSTESSSIEIKRNEGTGEIDSKVDSTCDLCKGEKGPLCAKYCFYGALKVVS
ncbi:MAG: hypothetical protein ABH852_01230 [Methanobacteriota archaeon]